MWHPNPKPKHRAPRLLNLVQHLSARRESSFAVFVLTSKYPFVQPGKGMERMVLHVAAFGACHSRLG